jgi:hypothetical protein
MQGCVVVCAGLTVVQSVWGGVWVLDASGSLPEGAADTGSMPLVDDGSSSGLVSSGKLGARVPYPVLPVSSLSAAGYFEGPTVRTSISLPSSCGTILDPPGKEKASAGYVPSPSPGRIAVHPWLLGRLAVGRRSTVASTGSIEDAIVSERSPCPSWSPWDSCAVSCCERASDERLPRLVHLVGWPRPCSRRRPNRLAKKY